MPEHLQFDEDAIVNPETRHEESDINVRALFLFMIVFIVFAVVSHFGLLLMFRTFRNIGDRPGVPLTQMQTPPDANVPVGPRLQPFPDRDARGAVILPNSNTPVTDMEEMRAHEDLILQHYGWTDREHGMVHIPIEQAKQMMLLRGFPMAAVQTTSGSEAQASPAAAAPVVAPAVVGTVNGADAAPRKARP